MQQFASLLTIALGIVAVTVGAVRGVFSEPMIAVAQRLGQSPRLFRIRGAGQVVLGLALVAAVQGSHGAARIIDCIASGILLVDFGVETSRLWSNEAARRIAVATVLLPLGLALLLLLRLVG